MKLIFCSILIAVIAASALPFDFTTASLRGDSDTCGTFSMCILKSSSKYIVRGTTSTTREFNEYLSLHSDIGCKETALYLITLKYSMKKKNATDYELKNNAGRFKGSKSFIDDYKCNAKADTEMDLKSVTCNATGELILKSSKSQLGVTKTGPISFTKDKMVIGFVPVPRLSNDGCEPLTPLALILIIVGVVVVIVIIVVVIILMKKKKTTIPKK